MIEKLHYITQDVEGFSHAELAEQACKGGAKWVQLRVKNKTAREWFDSAEQTKEVCKRYKATFIINDNVELAKELNADGVHLGKEDMSVEEARKILGENAIIGGTANTLEDVVKLINSGVNYIGLGPFCFTSTKANLSPILGIEGYRLIITQLRTLNFELQIPLIAIGGIKPEDIELIMQTGVYGLAISSAVNLDSNRENRTRIFLNQLNEFNLCKSV